MINTSKNDTRKKKINFRIKSLLNNKVFLFSNPWHPGKRKICMLTLLYFFL